MSYNLRNIREISTDETTKFINSLAKKISEFANAQQTQELENKEDIYSAGQDVDSVLKLHALNSTKKFTFDLPFYPPTEPDLDTVRVWIRGVNMGNTISEISGFNRSCKLNGDPILVDGTPHDDGIHTGGFKSLALRFNRPTSALENQEYIRLENLDSTTMDILNATAPGKSYFMRFKVASLSQQDSTDRRLFEKTDDATPNNGIVVKLTTSGRVIAQVVKGGTTTTKQTGTGKIVVGNVYDLWITYTISGNVIHIYINNVDESLSDPGVATNWHGDLTDVDMFIFRRGLGSSSGYVYGDFYDFRIYDEKVMTSSSIGNSIGFDGVNDNVNCGNDASLWSQSLSKFSFAFWAYPELAWDGAVRDIIRHGASGAGRFFCEWDDNTTGEVRFNIRNAADTTTFTARNQTASLNAWNHIVCVYDNSLGSANLKVYVNGVVGATTANLTDAINLSATLLIGGTSNDHDGNMKDFRWYTTKALTQTEINNIYNNSLSAPTPNYWLKMNEGSGNPVDTITFTKVGTLTNGAFWITDEIGNHYRNKWTIADIPSGQVMITNYYSTYIEQTAGYDSVAYDSTAYDTV